MFCANCGTENGNGEKYCKNCGAVLDPVSGQMGGSNQNTGYNGNTQYQYNGNQQPYYTYNRNQFKRTMFRLNISQSVCGDILDTNCYSRFHVSV